MSTAWAALGGDASASLKSGSGGGEPRAAARAAATNMCHKHPPGKMWVPFLYSLRLRDCEGIRVMLRRLQCRLRGEGGRKGREKEKKKKNTNEKKKKNPKQKRRRASCEEMRRRRRGGKAAGAAGEPRPGAERCAGRRPPRGPSRRGAGAKRRQSPRRKLNK